MKILVFSGGLGNQIFGYAFYNYLKETYPEENIYGLYPYQKMKEHHGLEIDKYFETTLPTASLLSNVVAGLLFLLKRLGISNSKVDMNTRTFNPSTIVNIACKTHRDYLPPKIDWLKFGSVELNNLNIQTLADIQASNSVFVHIRRGDYYSPRYIKKLGGTCPIDYYKKAIDYIESHVHNPRYFIFSDDMEWAKKNVMVRDAKYVNWNTGDNSYLDMYLMSHCKYAIIANSTFSFWGAMLVRKKEIVCYPEKWVNPPYKAPEICPMEWVKL